VLVDKCRECTAIIMENLEHTRLADKATVVTADYVEALRRLSSNGMKFDIIFLDPPYNKNFVQDCLKNLVINDIMKNDSILVAEHRFNDILPEQDGNLKMVRSVRYGDTVLSFYKKVQIEQKN